MPAKPQDGVELDVFIPTRREAKNLKALLPWVWHTLNESGIRARVSVVDSTGDEETREVCRRHGVVFLRQDKPGFGEAMRLAWRSATAPHLLTMDADLSHPPDFILRLWEARDRADVVIASRYVEGGGAQTSPLRIALSRVLNLISRKVLQTNVRDLTSNFRLYRTEVLRGASTRRIRFDVLQEVLVALLNRGCSVCEVPFFYEPRFAGASNVRLWSFGLDYLKAVVKDWRGRNSTDAVDYDLRAHDSIVPLQRYWQRRRHRIVSEMAAGSGRVADIGCGSSRIILDHPDWIGLDVNLLKLRYLGRRRAGLVAGSVSDIPLRDASVDCIVCSQVIEHIRDLDRFWAEFRRVLRGGGRLVLGTPDYGLPFWPFFEYWHAKALPEGYMQEHCTRWTKKSLLARLQAEGFLVERWSYILGGELIVQATRAPGGRAV
jgi:dolichol-phosphate mannosyltransferase